jgi:hypothetical protein
MLLINVGSNPLVLKHDVTSTAAKRFYCPGAADVTLSQYGWALLWYDVTLSRYVVATGSGGGGGGSKITHTYVFTPKGQDLVVNEDWMPLRAIKLPPSGSHGTYAALRVRVRAGTAGTGTNTVEVQTSTTHGGARTQVATVALGTSTEPADVTSFTGSWVPASDEYIWVRATAVGATAPKDVQLELLIQETTY